MYLTERAQEAEAQPGSDAMDLAEATTGFFGQESQKKIIESSIRWGEGGKCRIGVSTLAAVVWMHW